MASPVLLVIGAGPGISGSLARLYAADGYDVGLVGVDADVLAPDGIRATTVTVRGSLSEEGPFSPSRVAAAIHDAARQDADTWQVEVPHDG